MDLSEIAVMKMCATRVMPMWIVAVSRPAPLENLFDPIFHITGEQPFWAAG